MSALLGAWALDRQKNIEACVSAATRGLLRRELAAFPASELLSGRLWLYAADARLAIRDHRALGAEGLLALGATPLDSLLTQVAPAPEGHFSLATVDDHRRGQAGSLRLLRGLSGGEHLYYFVHQDVVFFSASLRPLLRHPAVAGTLDRARARELLLVGLSTFGDKTVVYGVHEVLAGQALTFGSAAPQSDWPYREALASATGSPPELARAFREKLATAIELALPRQRPLVVALSGGIDSSAIAAAAVEVAGAKQVVALTYEFEDPLHQSELGYAALVCKRLGIRDHRVFRLRAKEFVETIPEAVWRAESSVYWTKSFLLQVARKVRSYGFDRLLTGFGIGSHMSYLRELGRLLAVTRRLPLGPLVGAWRAAIFEGLPWLERLARLHPSLEAPHPRLLHILSQRLKGAGLLGQPACAYPRAISALLEELPALEHGALDAAGVPLWQSLQWQCCAHLLSCVDVTRSEKSFRELGVQRISPAHFAMTIPYAYFPIDPPPPLFSAGRRQRPGKQLLQLAYRGLLPDAVLDRKKNWDDAVASREWRRQGRVMMLRALPRFASELAAIAESPQGRAALLAWEPRSILANGLSFLFYKRLLLDPRAANDAVPSWDALLAPPRA